VLAAGVGPLHAVEEQLDDVGVTLPARGAQQQMYGDVWQDIKSRAAWLLSMTLLSTANLHGCCAWHNH
jgi:hypothetical protein